VNRITVAVGIAIVAAGAILIGKGFFEKNTYENCLRWLEGHYMDSGTSVPMQCQSDQSQTFFLAGLLLKAIGSIVLLLGLKGLPLLPSLNSEPQKENNHHQTF
jgi:hypothetical protein